MIVEQEWCAHIDGVDNGIARLTLIREELKIDAGYIYMRSFLGDPAVWTCRAWKVMPVGKFVHFRYTLIGDKESWDVFYADENGNVLMNYVEIICHELDLFIKEDKGEIEAAVTEVIAANEKAVNDYRAGKKAAMNSLFGQVMKRLKGADHKLIREKLQTALDN